MLFLRLLLVFTFVTLATPDANAQLFRFRRQAQQLPPQAPSRYDARSYQYAPLQQPQSTVPSQRYTAQVQTPNCNRQQAPANANVVQQQRAVAAAQQQQLAQQRAAAQMQQQAVAAKQQQAIAANQQPVVLVQKRVVTKQQAEPTQQVTVLQRPVSSPVPQQPQVQNQSTSRVVMMTFRDARTGQLFQRPYLVANPQTITLQPNVAAQQSVANVSQPQPASIVARTYIAPTAATPIPATTAPTSLAQTSFESPILDPVEPPQAPQEFSVFNQEEPAPAAAPGISAVQDSLPELDLEIDTLPSSTEIKASTDLDLDFDLPPLNPQADE